MFSLHFLSQLRKGGFFQKKKKTRNSLYTVLVPSSPDKKNEIFHIYT